MIIGAYVGVLGDKRRVAVPKKFIEELGTKLILAKWYEDCLVMVSLKTWKLLLARLTGGSRVINLGVRDIERFILGSAFEVEPDAQGRIIVPEILADYSNLNNELIFLGLGDRVEVWAKEVWEEKAKVIGHTSKDYIEKLSQDGKR